MTTNWIKNQVYSDRSNMINKIILRRTRAPPDAQSWCCPDSSGAQSQLALEPTPALAWSYDWTCNREQNQNSLFIYLLQYSTKKLESVITNSVSSSMTLCFSLISSLRRASCLWCRPRWDSTCWRDGFWKAKRPNVLKYADQICFQYFSQPYGF